MDEQGIQDIEIIFRGDVGSRVFTSILGYQLGSGFLGVQTREGKLFIFPQDRIEEVIYTQQ